MRWWWAVALVVFVGCGDEVTGGGGSETTADGGGGNNAGGNGGAATVGGGGSGGSVSSGGAAPICDSDGTACGDCLVTSCNDALCTCQEQASCVTLGECVEQCGPNTPGCAIDCFSLSPDAVSEHKLLLHCAATSCDSDCMVPPALNNCQLCQFTTCEAEVEACFADADCAAFRACVAACGPNEQMCAQNCLQQHPDAAPLQQAIRQCAQDNCPCMMMGP